MVRRRLDLKIFLSIAAAFFVCGCELTEEDKNKVGELFDPPVAQPWPEEEPLCFNDRFKQPEAEVTKKVDLLFVTDTSSSLNDERAEIADGIDAFVRALPADVDYQIGVMLGHGGRGNHWGQLWKYRNDPHVLKSSEMSLTEIREHLRTKLMNVAGDTHSDGGEEGLYSLYKSLSGGKLASMRAHGFYRQDAALAIVFIADENDICADYPAGITPVVDRDGKEEPAKIRDCAGINSGEILLGLRKLQGDKPLLVSGIVYVDPTKVPQGNEDEVGYGYLDLINAANGISIEMADGNYRAGLSNIGLLTSVKLNLQSEFKLTRDKVDSSTIGVKIDGAAASFNYLTSLNEVHLTQNNWGMSGSTVDISYCQIVPPTPTPPPGCIDFDYCPQF